MASATACRCCKPPTPASPRCRSWSIPPSRVANQALQSDGRPTPPSRTSPSTITGATGERPPRHHELRSTAASNGDQRTSITRRWSSRPGTTVDHQRDHARRQPDRLRLRCGVARPPTVLFGQLLTSACPWLDPAAGVCPAPPPLRRNRRIALGWRHPDRQRQDHHLQDRRSVALAGCGQCLYGSGFSGTDISHPDGNGNSTRLYRHTPPPARTPRRFTGSRQRSSSTSASRRQPRPSTARQAFSTTLDFVGHDLPPPAPPASPTRRRSPRAARCGAAFSITGKRRPA